MKDPIVFHKVWKKFKKGEKFNSLRDTVPNLFKKIFKKAVLDNENLLDKEFWAVKDVSFKVKKGEVLGIIGPNGAGKSTILKLLSGILAPNQGEISINGRLSALIEVTAGFHPELTGRENVYLNGTILGMKKKEIDDRIEDMIDFSGIEEFIDTPIKRYSSGMMSRLGFSVAAYVNPEVLLVDEVLAVGDIAFRSKCAQKMRELMRTGVTICLVSHNLPLIQSLCERVILLNKGGVVKDGTPEVVIPFYENIVFDQKEEEIRRKLDASYKVKVTDESPLEITNVTMLNEKQEKVESFESNENITMRVEFLSRKRILDPVFSLEIMRSDGVTCCAANTKDDKYKVGLVDGKGELEINLGNLNLAAGVYLPRISVWDQDFMHPYAHRKNDVLRISQNGNSNQCEAVFLPQMKWKR